MREKFRTEEKKNPVPIPSLASTEISMEDQTCSSTTRMSFSQCNSPHTERARSAPQHPSSGNDGAFNARVL